MPVKSEEKIFPNLVQALTNTLKAIFIDHRYADKALEYTLHSNKKWGARDRAFIAENTYDIVRNFRLLQFVYGKNDLNETAFKNYFSILKIHKDSAFDVVKS